jgi:hypothetical protein
MLGFDPVKAALHDAEKRINAVDLNHNGHSDMEEIKQEFAVVKARLEHAYAFVSPIAAKVDQAKINAAMALPVVQEVLHALGITAEELKAAFASAKEVGEALKQITALADRAGKLAHALAGE